MLNIWYLNLSYMYLLNQHWSIAKRIQCQHILLIHGKCSILRSSDACVKQKHAGLADMQRRGKILHLAVAPALGLDAMWKDKVQAHVTLAGCKSRSVRTCLLSSFKQLAACRGQNDLLHTFLWRNSEYFHYHSGWLQLVNLFWAVLLKQCKVY